MDSALAGIAIGGVVVVGLFLVLRYVVLWYWRVGEVVMLLREIRDSLRAPVVTRNATPPVSVRDDSAERRAAMDSVLARRSTAT